MSELAARWSIQRPESGTGKPLFAAVNNLGKLVWTENWARALRFDEEINAADFAMARLGEAAVVTRHTIH